VIVRYTNILLNYLLTYSTGCVLNDDAVSSYHDDEDVGDVESSSSGGVRTAREGRMYAVLGAVAGVELADAASERFDLVVESPLLLVDERLDVDGRPLQLVILQRDLVLATLRRDLYRQVLGVSHHVELLRFMCNCCTQLLQRVSVRMIAYVTTA